MFSYCISDSSNFPTFTTTVAAVNSSLGTVTGLSGDTRDLPIPTNSELGLYYQQDKRSCTHRRHFGWHQRNDVNLHRSSLRSHRAWNNEISWCFPTTATVISIAATQHDVHHPLIIPACCYRVTVAAFYLSTRKETQVAADLRLSLSSTTFFVVSAVYLATQF